MNNILQKSVGYFLERKLIYIKTFKIVEAIFNSSKFKENSTKILAIKKYNLNERKKKIYLTNTI